LVKVMNNVEPAGSAWPPGGGHAHEHFVQFYESDDFLLNSLSDFIGEGLWAGDACVVVAGGPRRAGLDERLRAAGVDVDAARARGQYVALDSGETLAQFMVGGRPDAGRFTEVIGGVLERAAAGRRATRVFGDMVAHLCGEQNHTAAVGLEGLWNGLRETRPFSLFCAYPLEQFGCTTLAAPFDDLCAAHTRVLPAESYAAATETDERLRTVAFLQQKARSLEAEVAERRRVEESLRALNEQLERELAERGRLLAREQAARAETEAANRLKDEFLANVSHELRTPLTAVLGWTHVLRSGRLDPESTARALDTVERNARAQNQLIEDLLDMSRIITGKLRFDARTVDPVACVEAALDSVRPAAEAKGVRLERSSAAAVGAVSGDPDRLQQVVWNLLTNAIKFTPAGGSVRVTLGGDDARVEIAVSDTGAGIGPEFLPYVFDRFRQADGTTTRAQGGLGLGLAIVRHLVELHGGTVRAESEGEGHGATFTVSLPRLRHAEVGSRNEAADAAFAEGDESASHHPQSAVLSGVRALVVDDEADACELLGVLLRERGAEVSVATTADEALAALERARPHLLISDIGMPGVDGYEFLRRVRRLPPESGGRTPAVALTAYAGSEDRLRALKAGYQMHLPKPVEPAELIAVVASLTNRG
jgi:signal transduction histidine kinase/ActR/RegA family two-component response regulator